MMVVVVVVVVVMVFLPDERKILLKVLCVNICI
jgi:hypothetical protein